MFFLQDICVKLYDFTQGYEKSRGFINYEALHLEDRFKTIFMALWNIFWVFFLSFWLISVYLFLGDFALNSTILRGDQLCFSKYLKNSMFFQSAFSKSERSVHGRLFQIKIIRCFQKTSYFAMEIKNQPIFAYSLELRI